MSYVYCYDLNICSILYSRFSHGGGGGGDWEEIPGAQICVLGATIMCRQNDVLSDRRATKPIKRERGKYCGSFGSGS